jgi:phage repressor protein C with HTH and peptisase S24 domain
MTTNIRISEKIYKIRKALKINDHIMSQEKFGSLIGVTKNTVYNWEKGDTEPDELDRQVIERTLKVNPKFWKDDDVEMFLQEPLTFKEDAETGYITIESDFDPSMIHDDKFVSVNIFTSAGAGDPLDFTQVKPLETIPLPKELVNDFKNAVRIKGQSMVPTLPSGTIVGINLNNKKITSGDLYCLYFQYEGYVVKRLILQSDKLLIKSDNEHYFPVEEKPRDYLDDENFLIGKIVWWWYSELNKGRV